MSKALWSICIFLVAVALTYFVTTYVVHWKEYRSKRGTNPDSTNTEFIQYFNSMDSGWLKFPNAEPFIKLVRPMGEKPDLSKRNHGFLKAYYLEDGRISKVNAINTKGEIGWKVHYIYSGLFMYRIFERNATSKVILYQQSEEGGEYQFLASNTFDIKKE